MSQQPPVHYRRFVEQFPKVAEAWETLREGEDGPLERKEQRLIKVAVAITVGLQGMVKTTARKAIHAGATLEELEQVISLSASAIGFPACVKAYNWIAEEWETHESRGT